MISYVRNVGKTVLAAVVSLVFIVGAAGCGNTQKDDGPDYADDEAMSIIAKSVSEAFGCSRPVRAEERYRFRQACQRCCSG